MGRLIDVCKVVRKINSAIEQMGKASETAAGNEGFQTTIKAYKDVRDAIMREPTAEPRQKAQENRMADLIDRQAAIDALDKRFDSIPMEQTTEILLLRKDLRDLPPAERKTGRWINAYPDIEPNPMFMYGICSECGFEQSISDRLNFCPNCGAYMRGEQNG